MDTRAKIVDLQNLRRDGRPLKLIIGYFDPLHAAHIERLRELCTPGEQVVIAVADPPNSLLSSRARCELVAALRCADYVISYNEGVVAQVNPQTMVDEREQDARRRRELSELAVRRHQLR